MKLTKTVKNKFIEAVLTNEVEAPAFAEEIEENWVQIVALLMPVNIAIAYKSTTTRHWFSVAEVMKVRSRVSSAPRASHHPKIVEYLDKIDAVEKRRAQHQATIDNILDALNTACNAVTTVAGLRKLLPQYSKYLPAEGSRPDDATTKSALQGLATAIKTANITAATSKGTAKAKKPRAATRKPRAAAVKKEN